MSFKRGNFVAGPDLQVPHTVTLDGEYCVVNRSQGILGLGLRPQVTFGREIPLRLITRVPM